MKNICFFLLLKILFKEKRIVDSTFRKIVAYLAKAYFVSKSELGE